LSDEAPQIPRGGAVKTLSSKQRLALVAVVVLLGLFLVRPGASRLKSRIITSLSAAVGRPVDLGSAHIRLLPRPGFDLENLVVYDDPEFGAEPMLRASDVTADLRLMSLLRGRIEVARLDLTEPSLNLVHSEAGRWNLEALLERAAHTPLAPTGKAKSEPRPRFPYIECSSGRINFKNGPVKRPYALTNADFSLWQESENTWGVRLKAQPFRSDMNLNDTGLLQVNGTWQRAETFRDTPMDFSISWSRAQLGQATKFFTGYDKGWRGGIRFDVVMTGSPAKLRVASTASIDDFRRYDIASGSALRLAARCDAEYSSVNHEFHDALCTGPVGNGLVTLTGDVGLPGSHHYDLVLTAEDVPASAIVGLVQRAKRNLPDDLEAEGTLHGKFVMQQDGSKSRFDGQGEIVGLQLSSLANKAEFGPTAVPFVVVSSAKQKTGKPTPSGFLVGHTNGRDVQLEVGPVGIDAGRNGANAQGWLGRSGYKITVAGEADITKVLHLGRMIGVEAPEVAAIGPAQMNLQVAGAWNGPSGEDTAGFMGPQITGSAKLKNVQATMRGAGPVEIVSADLQLSPDAIRVGKLNAKAAGTVWTGTLEMPRGCASPEKCPVQFALHAEEITLGAVNDWANAKPRKRPWYRMLQGSSSSGPSFLARVHATGQVSTKLLMIHGIEARHASGSVILDSGTLQVSGLEADFLGGKHRGNWQADFSAKPPACSGSGSVAGISLAKLAEAMKDNWIAGTASGTYEVKGPCAAGFWESAEGLLHVEMRDGGWRDVSVGDERQPLEFSRLKGQARLRGGKIEINDARMSSADGEYQLSGTASLKREIDLRMSRVDGATTGYAITGTLDEPKVSPLSKTEQARLKP